MMNFTNLKITEINNNDRTYDVHFSYKIGEENREGSIYIDCIDPTEICIYADFENSPKEILARDDFRLLPNGEVEFIHYTNDGFVIGDTLSPQQEEFLNFLKTNGVPTTPEEGEKWYWKLYHNREWFGNYNKSSL